MHSYKAGMSTKFGSLSLSGLKAFEIAGNHLSFTLAAKELFLTQGAVSKQVKSLEEELGFKLFHRLTRKLEFTEEGKQLHQTVTVALSSISDKVYTLSQNQAERSLIVSAPPSFSMKWLIPRMGDFKARHPEIDAYVDVESKYVDLGSTEADLLIRYGDGNYKDCVVIPLMEEYLIPVCSPKLIPKGLERVQQLENFKFLHDRNQEKWDYWFKSTGNKNYDNRSGTRFSRDDLVIQAAIAGQGIAVSRLSLVKDDIDSGELIQLFDYQVTSWKSYYLLCLKENLEKPHFKTIIQWLQAITSK